MLLLTVVPLVVLGILSSGDAKSIGCGGTEDARVMGEVAIVDSVSALNSLGEDMIRQTALLVSKQLEIYIRENPEMTVEDLQNDEYFSSLAVQPVGETGYTAVLDADDSTAYFHPNDALVNTLISDLAGKLPEMWVVVNGSLGSRESGGYYDWEDADGVIRSKYMYIVPVGAKTADGVSLEVPATTYIDEFSAPAKEIEKRLSASIDETVGKIENSTEGVNIENTIFMVTFITILIVIIISYFVARSISNPIRRLKRAADRVTSGKGVELPSLKGCPVEEVVELTGSMEMLIASSRAGDSSKLRAGKSKKNGKKKGKV